MTNAYLLALQIRVVQNYRGEGHLKKAKRVARVGGM
jgi:hypothetical protein